MDERFGPEHRLRQRLDVERVYRLGVMAKSPNLRVFVLPRGDRDGDGTPRLGLSIGTKVGSAVERNRLKRWIREWFRTHKRSVWGWDVVVQAKPSASELDFSTLSEQLARSTSQLRERLEERSEPHER